MQKFKAVLFILTIGFAHLCGTFYLIADRMSRYSCNFPPYTDCITPASRVLEVVVSFPLLAAMHLLGIQLGTHLYTSLLVVNSLAAGALIWLISQGCIYVLQMRRKRSG